MTTTKKYIRGWASIAERYGVTPRSIQRMTKDGRLPMPVYIGGSRFPLWEIELLDKHDREIIQRRVSRKDHAGEAAATGEAA